MIADDAPYTMLGRGPVREDEELSTLPSSAPVQFWTRSERRLWLVAMFLCCVVVYAARTVMPICVVPISVHYNWTKTDSGTALSAFFWGYATTQIIGGYLSDRLGGDTVICFSVIGWSLMTLITPLVVRLGDKTSALQLFALARALTGCFQGVHFPAMTSLFSKKISETERGLSFSFSSSGTHFGTILIGCVGSLLLERFGWTYPFYGIGESGSSYGPLKFDPKIDSNKGGMLGLLWFLIVHFQMMGGNSRRVDALFTKWLLDDFRPTISAKYTPLPVPWMQLFRAPPFWAVIFSQFCSSWTFYILFSWIPTYFHENYPAEKGWMFNVIPWAVAIPCQWLSGWIADHLISIGYSTTFTRKLIQSISFVGTAFFLVSLTHITGYHWALTCMSCAIGFLAFHHGGLAVNVQDIAPDFSGSVFGMMNTAGAIPGFIGVYVAGYLLERTHSWDMVFNLTACICMVGCMVFGFFSTGRRIV